MRIQDLIAIDQMQRQSNERNRQGLGRLREGINQSIDSRRMKKVGADLMKNWDGTGQGLMDYAKSNNVSMQDLNTLAPMLNNFLKMHQIDLTNRNAEQAYQQRGANMARDEQRAIRETGRYEEQQKGWDRAAQDRSAIEEALKNATPQQQEAHRLGLLGLKQPEAQYPSNVYKVDPQGNVIERSPTSAEDYNDLLGDKFQRGKYKPAKKEKAEKAEKPKSISTKDWQTNLKYAAESSLKDAEIVYDENSGGYIMPGSIGEDGLPELADPSKVSEIVASAEAGAKSVMRAGGGEDFAINYDNFKTFLQNKAQEEAAAKEEQAAVEDERGKSFIQALVEKEQQQRMRQALQGVGNPPGQPGQQPQPEQPGQPGQGGQQPARFGVAPGQPMQGGKSLRIPIVADILEALERNREWSRQQGQ